MSAFEVQVEAGTLVGEEAGSGPPIVLLHGFSLDRRMWAPQVAALSGRFRTIRYDLRGFGDSSLPEGPYDHAEDLGRVLEALDVREPVLVGLSLGANVVLSFATRFPGRARGLVLASPGLPGHEWREERPPEAARRRAEEHGVEAARRFWREHALFASVDERPEAREAVDAMLSDYTGWHWGNVDPQRPAGFGPEELAGVTAPALVLGGARDVAGYREIAQRIGAALPHGRLEVAGEAGHMLNLESPEWFNERVGAFAADQEAALLRREVRP